MQQSRVSFTAWTYDRATGALQGSCRVWPEFTAGGETIYRLPAATTLIEPPDVGDDQVAVFLESTQAWIAVTDCRGQTWLDDFGRNALVVRLGDPRLWGWKERLV